MQGMDNFKKETDAQQVKMINNFKNVKQKLLKCSDLIQQDLWEKSTNTYMRKDQNDR